MRKTLLLAIFASVFLAGCEETLEPKLKESQVELTQAITVPEVYHLDGTMFLCSDTLVTTDISGNMNLWEGFEYADTFTTDVLLPHQYDYCLAVEVDVYTNGTETLSDDVPVVRRICDGIYGVEPYYADAELSLYEVENF